MPFSKYMPIPIFIAFQAFTMMAITPFIAGTDEAAFGKGNTGLLSWVAFQAWAMYFLAGCTPKMGLKTLVGYLGGIIASIAIFELGFKAFGSLNGATPWGLYLAVFVVVVFVISAERVPGIDFVPSYFLGAGVFFGLMTYLNPPAGIEKLSLKWYGTLALPEMIACATGLVYGWWTVTVKTWYVAKVTAAVPVSPAVEADVASA